MKNHESLQGERLLRPREAARLLGICVRTLWNWDRKGLIRCVKTPGGHRRIPLSEVLRLMGLKPETEWLRRIEAEIQERRAFLEELRRRTISLLDK